MNDKTAFLQITSWVGISIGATHVYGSLRIQDESFEVECPLTPKEAKYLNKTSGISYAMYRVGEMDTRISTITKAHKAGIKLFLEKRKDEVVLLTGSSYASSHYEEVLWMEDKETMETLNSVREEIEELYKLWDDPCDERGYKEATVEWDRIFETYCNGEDVT